MSDEISGVSLKTAEKFGLQATEICTSLKATEMSVPSNKEENFLTA